MAPGELPYLSLMHPGGFPPGAFLVLNALRQEPFEPLSYIAFRFLTLKRTFSSL